MSVKDIFYSLAGENVGGYVFGVAKIRIESGFRFRFFILHLNVCGSLKIASWCSFSAYVPEIINGKNTESMVEI